MNPVRGEGRRQAAAPAPRQGATQRYSPGPLSCWCCFRLFGYANRELYFFGNAGIPIVFRMPYRSAPRGVSAAGPVCTGDAACAPVGDGASSNLRGIGKDAVRPRVRLQKKGAVQRSQQAIGNPNRMLFCARFSSPPSGWRVYNEPRQRLYPIQPLNKSLWFAESIKVVTPLSYLFRLSRIHRRPAAGMSPDSAPGRDRLESEPGRESSCDDSTINSTQM